MYGRSSKNPARDVACQGALLRDLTADLDLPTF